jgi:hypothetical protein
LSSERYILIREAAVVDEGCYLLAVCGKGKATQQAPLAWMNSACKFPQQGEGS